MISLSRWTSLAKFHLIGLTKIDVTQEQLAVSIPTLNCKHARVVNSLFYSYSSHTELQFCVVLKCFTICFVCLRLLPRFLDASARLLSYNSIGVTNRPIIPILSSQNNILLRDKGEIKNKAKLVKMFQDFLQAL